MAIIAKADKDFDNKNYTNAETGYQNALKLKSDDQYAKDKLTQTQTAAQQIASKNQALKDSVVKAGETNKQ